MENIGKHDETFPPYGTLHHNGRSITHHMDVIDLPEDSKRDQCIEHLKAGAASELLEDFVLGYCKFPEAGQPAEIRTALVCPGVSVLKKCRLALLQADMEGKVIGKVTATSKP